MFKNKYRVIRDSYSGYEVQVKFWYFPLLWLQIGRYSTLGTNTVSSLEDAKHAIKAHKVRNKPVYEE